MQDYDLENGVKVTKNFTCFNSVTTIYPLKSDEYPSICSRNISFFSNKINFCQLANDLENGVKVTYVQ